MKNLSSSTLLKIAFVISIGIMVFISAIIYQHITTLTETSKKVEHTYDVSLQIEKLYTAIKELEIERRNYLLTHDKKLINDISISKVKINDAILTLKNLTTDNSLHQKKIKKIQNLLTQKFQIVNQSIAQEEKSSLSTQSLKENLLQGSKIMQKIKTQVDDMLYLENKLLEKRTQKNYNANKFTPFIIYITLFTTLGLITLAFIKIINDLDRLTSTNNDLQLANESSKLAEEIGNFGVWKWDINQNKYYYSDNIYRILGNKPQEFPETLEGFMNHIHPEDLEFVQSNVATMIETNSFTPFKYRIIRNDNKQTRYFFANNRLLTNEAGDQYLLGTTTDITDQVLSAKAIEYRNAELEKFNNELMLSNEANSFGEKIGKYGNWQWHIKQNKWYFSENLYHILGVEPYSFEANLENFFKFIHPEDLNDVMDKAALLAEMENLPTVSYRIIKLNGDIIYVRSIGRPVIDKNGNKLIAGMTQDITEDVLINEDIAKQNKILEATNKELQAFNYVASHDLQEPLRKIQTFISRLKDKEFENLSESGKEYLLRITSSAERMRVLIDDLLQFSRTNRTEKVFEKCDLNILLDNAKGDLAQIIEEKQALITAENLPTLSAIPFQIQQLFTNLVGNSLKYSKTDLKPIITITATIISHQEDPILPKNALTNFYKIDVIDNGIGFEQQYADRIFTLFSRLHNKNEYAGTGIGLAICKKIIENHNGYITASAVPDEGATFTIYLPVT